MTDQLYDIYDMWHVPFWQTPTFYWVSIGLGSVIGTALLYRLWRFVYRRWCATHRTPWEKALAMCDALAQQSYTTQDDGHAFYVTLTALVKEYTQDRFAVDVQGKTDDELVVMVRNQHLPEQMADTLSTIIDGARMVKFANMQAVRTTIERDLAATRLLIEQTIPSDNQTT